MIKNKKLLESFEKEFIRNSKTDIEQKFFILNELYKLSKSLGKFPPKNYLEDIELDFKYARAINGIMDLKELIKNLAKALDRNDIKYMITGGFAILIYGEPRLTKDIDIIIGLDIKGIKKLKNVIKKLNLKVIPQNPKEFVEETMVLPTIDKKTGFRIDFILSTSNYQKEALRRAKRIEIDNVEVRYVSIEDLIIHKVISGRERDLEDVRLVLIKNKRINEDYIFKWLLEFEKVLQENLIEKFKKVKKEVER